MLTELLTRFRSHETQSRPAMPTREQLFADAEQIDADELAGESLRAERDAALARVDHLKGQLADAQVELNQKAHRHGLFTMLISQRRQAVRAGLVRSADPRIGDAIAALWERRDMLSKEMTFAEVSVPTGSFHGPTHVIVETCINGDAINERANEINQAVHHLNELKLVGMDGDDLEEHLVGVIADLLGPVV